MTPYGIIVTICISAILADDAHYAEDRISGGSNARRGQFPYQLSMLANGQHFCGASILTSVWIITAAHCCDKIPLNRMQVVAGMIRQGENHPDVQISKIRQAVVHPYYPKGSNDAAPYDIAVVQLLSPLRWTNVVKPIGLPRENEEFSGLGWASGWGIYDYHKVVAIDLQQVQLKLLTTNECANLLARSNSRSLFNDDMLCVVGAYKGDESTCQGDSGGPIMQNGKLVGITSWGLDVCGGIKGVPSVFTKVSRYIGFIRQNVPGV